MWKSIEKDGYPLEGCVCLVTNVKGWMHDHRAIFYPEDKLFVSYEFDHRYNLPLEVTHYFVIPPFAVED